MDSKRMFEDYLGLLKMNADRKCKIKILQRLVEQGTNNWRVVGITPNALRKFATQNFVYKTRCGIQRAHLVRRHDTFGALIDEEHVEAEFWGLISEQDKTILAIRGEYNSVSAKAAIPIPDAGLFPADANPILFESRSVGYKCGPRESRFLKELHAKYFP